MHIMIELFLDFAKIGLFTIGGGYAMIPQLPRRLPSAIGLPWRGLLIS